MKNFTSRKAIVYLTLVAVISTMMVVNTVVAATSVLTPNQPPASTDYVSPTFTNLNVGSPTTGDDTGNLTVTGKTTIGNFTLKGGDGWEPFLTFGNDGWSFDADKFAEVKAAIESGDSSELQDLADSWASDEVMPFGLISNPNGLLLQAAKELKLSELTGSSDALSGLNGGILALLPKFGTFDINGTTIGISDVAFLGNTKAYVVTANVTSPEDPPGIVMLGGDLVRIMAPVDMSKALNVGDLLESDPNTGVTAINAFTIDAIYPIGRTGTQSAPKAPEASLIIRSSGGVNGESRDSSWMGFSGTTILSNAQKYFKIIPYNGLRTVLIGETTSSGAINTAADKKYNFSVTGDANVAGVLTVGTLAPTNLNVAQNASVGGTLTVGTLSLTNLTVANDATVNGNLNVTSAASDKGKITTKDLSVTGTFIPNSLNVTGTSDLWGNVSNSNAVSSVQQPVTVSDPEGLVVNGNGGLKTNNISSTLGGNNPLNINTPLTITGGYMLRTDYIYGTTAGSSVTFNNPLVAAVDATVNGALKANTINARTAGSAITIDKLTIGGASDTSNINGSLNVAKATTVGTTLSVPNGLTTLKDLTVTGSFSPASLAVTGAATVGSTLGVSGASTLSSLGVTNGVTVGTTLNVTGVSTLDSLTVTKGATVGGNLNIPGNIGNGDPRLMANGGVAIDPNPPNSGITINDDATIIGDLSLNPTDHALLGHILGVDGITSNKDNWMNIQTKDGKSSLLFATGGSGDSSIDLTANGGTKSGSIDFTASGTSSSNINLTAPNTKISGNLTVTGANTTDRLIAATDCRTWTPTGQAVGCGWNEINSTANSTSGGIYSMGLDGATASSPVGPLIIKNWTGTTTPTWMGLAGGYILSNAYYLSMMPLGTARTFLVGAFNTTTKAVDYTQNYNLAVSNVITAKRFGHTYTSNTTTLLSAYNPSGSTSGYDASSCGEIKQTTNGPNPKAASLGYGTASAKCSNGGHVISCGFKFLETVFDGSNKNSSGATCSDTNGNDISCYDFGNVAKDGAVYASYISSDLTTCKVEAKNLKTLYSPYCWADYSYAPDIIYYFGARFDRAIQAVALCSDPTSTTAD